MIDRIYMYLHRLVSKREERGEYSAGYWQNQIREHAKEFCVENKGSLLDVGCGEGFLIDLISRKKPNVALWGIDTSQERIAKASQRLSGKNVNLSVGDATALSFPDGYFDTVVCVNVFFNMPSIEVVRKTLAQMARVCKTGGTLVFDFRNADNFLLAIKYGLAPLYDKTVKDLPLKTYRLRQFKEMLGPLRVKIVEQVHVGSFLNVPAPIIMIKAQKL